MSKHKFRALLSRRDLLRLSGGGAALISARAAFPELMSLAEKQVVAGQRSVGDGGLYGELLRTWCDGLLAHQVTAIKDPALHGGLLCPACGIIHGRCGDAVYPLLCAAHRTGEAKYLQGALLVHAWSERQVSRSDGSWVNDVTLSSWKGITVFHAIALAEALEHHGSVLDVAARRQWMDRLARAAKFLDGFITIETGNINYPVTASACFALCGKVLGDAHYVERGRKLAHTALEYLTEDGLLFGEGHPSLELSAKRCRPVDLGYNVEESLPALALYSVLSKDEMVREKTVAALKTHMEFMLPDGGWDNSWGTRNYKWTWWGSRTSDGCHPGYVLIAEYQMIEISNQQAFGDYPHMTLTPRMEWTSGGKTYTSLSDFGAEVTATNSAGEIVFDAQGRILTAGHQPPAKGEVKYRLVYRLSEGEVEIIASASGLGSASAPVQLIVPVVARSDEAVAMLNEGTVQITKQQGGLTVRVEGAEGFDAVPKERTFNLVPGFECVPLVAKMKPGKEVHVRIAAVKR